MVKSSKMMKVKVTSFIPLAMDGKFLFKGKVLTLPTEIAQKLAKKGLVMILEEVKKEKEKRR